jgi:hypothetical protein
MKNNHERKQNSRKDNLNTSLRFLYALYTPYGGVSTSTSLHANVVTLDELFVCLGSVCGYKSERMYAR